MSEDQKPQVPEEKPKEIVSPEKGVDKPAPKDRKGQGNCALDGPGKSVQ